MEMTMRLPANYNVMCADEMTYTEGGATAIEALCAWVIPFYGWFQGTMAIRSYRKANPKTWLETGLDAFSQDMNKGTMNLLYDLGCAAQFISVCATGVGLIPTALLVLP